MESLVAYTTQDSNIPIKKTQDTRTHVTALPRGFIIVRIMQLLFTIIILGLSAADFSTDNGLEAFIGMMTAIIGTIVYGWIILTYWIPCLYNYWAILAFEILSIFLWLDGFIFLLVNAITNGYTNYYDDCGYIDGGSNGTTITCEQVSSTENVPIQKAAIAAAALAGAELYAYPSLVSFII